MPPPPSREERAFAVCFAVRSIQRSDDWPASPPRVLRPFPVKSKPKSSSVFCNREPSTIASKQWDKPLMGRRQQCKLDKASIWVPTDMIGLLEFVGALKLVSSMCLTKVDHLTYIVRTVRITSTAGRRPRTTLLSAHRRAAVLRLKRRP